MKSTAIFAAFAAGALMFAAPQAANATPQPSGAKHLQTSNVSKAGYRHHRPRWRHRHYRSPRYYRHGYYGHRHGHRYYRRPGVGVYLGF